MRASVLPADQAVETHHDLCLTLGGDDTSFTGDLLRLIAKADPQNRHLLRRAFPGHVTAWETWQALAPHITAGHLSYLAADAEQAAQRRAGVSCECCMDNECECDGKAIVADFSR